MGLSSENRKLRDRQGILRFERENIGRWEAI